MLVSLFIQVTWIQIVNMHAKKWFFLDKLMGEKRELAVGFKHVVTLMLSKKIQTAICKGIRDLRLLIRYPT